MQSLPHEVLSLSALPVTTPTRSLTRVCPLPVLHARLKIFWTLSERA